MKFKKTSLIGVVFTLALVLALTAAFASDPKTPGNDTVEFHGQTFARADLSQSTQDWLDWYLALPEEEQLMVNYVPAELRPEQTPEYVDAPAQGNEPASFLSGDDYETHLPTVDENGVSRVYDDEGNLLVVGTPAEPAYEEEDGKDVERSSDPLQGSGYVSYDGQLPAAVGNEGSAAPAAPQATPAQPKTNTIPIPACGVAGCTETQRHQHAGGQCVLLGDPCPVAGCTTPGCHDHGDGTVYACNGFHSGGVCDGSCLVYNEPAQAVSPAPQTAPAQPQATPAPSNFCGVAGCAETRRHQHAGGQCVLLGDPCPVAGCTTPGCHDHGDGTVYACNGFHSGGVCDGSCYTYNAPSVTTTSGHHGGGHHGSGHH